MSVSKLSEYSREVWLPLFAAYILSCIVVEIIQRKKTGVAGEPLVTILWATFALIITAPLAIFAWVLTWILLYPMMGVFAGLHWLWGKMLGRNNVSLSKSARLVLARESVEQIAEQIRRIQAQPKPRRERADGYQQDGYQTRM